MYMTADTNLPECCRAPDGTARQRITQFKCIGMEAHLQDMLQDMSLDVRERVTSALDNFGCGAVDDDGDTSFEDPIDLFDGAVES